MLRFTLVTSFALLGLTSALPARAAAPDAAHWTTACNVVWTTPSKNAQGSMPLGNGEVGINLWVEEDGDLLFYVSRTDSMAESARLMKAGWVRVSLVPNPFLKGAPFRQELVLRDGVCAITAGEGDKRAKLRVFVASDAPVVHVLGEAATPLAVRATVESWRERWLDIRKSIDNESAWTMRRAPFPVIESADVFVSGSPDAVAWYHRNEGALAVPATLQLQSLETLADRVHDPLKNRTFGGWVTGTGLKTVDNRHLETAAPVRAFALRVAAPCEQIATADAWLDLAKRTAAESADGAAALARTARWWREFWDRSWVIVNDRPGQSKPGEASIYTRGYTLQRYMNACGGRGRFPIKFNGSIFTVEPYPIWPIPLEPDYRQWGDCHWWQNIRFPYHAMLPCGDFEMLDPMFRMYEAARPLCEGRAKAYYNVAGCYFPETMTVWGTYSNGDYGWNRTGRKPTDIEVQSWRTAWNQGPELVALMLDRWDYTGDEAFLKNEVLPMARSVLLYFDTRFKRDGGGKLVIQPTQAVETYQFDVVNDMPAVGGLRAITQRLCTLPENLVGPDERTLFARMKAACPAVPTETRQINGKTVRKLAPAEKYNPGRSNVENPETYAIWPYRLYGVGRPDLEVAKAAFETRPNPYLHAGWGYDGSCAALLGLTEHAAKVLEIQCRNSRGDYRWPATWGPNYDWHPDQTHGGNLMITAQCMLLQPVGEKLYLLPAWPQSWDVCFKLHAPDRTVVECSFRGGSIEKLEVTPKERHKDIVLPAGVEVAGLASPAVPAGPKVIPLPDRTGLGTRAYGLGLDMTTSIPPQRSGVLYLAGEMTIRVPEGKRAEQMSGFNYIGFLCGVDQIAAEVGHLNVRSFGARSDDGPSYNAGPIVVNAPVTIVLKLDLNKGTWLTYTSDVELARPEAQNRPDGPPQKWTRPPGAAIKRVAWRGAGNESGITFDFRNFKVYAGGSTPFGGGRARNADAP